MKFTLAVAFALHRNIITQHDAQHEILLGSQFVQRFIDERLHGVQAATLAEIEIDLLLRYRLQQIVDTLTAKPFDQQPGTGRAQRAEHQIPNALTEFVDMMHAIIVIISILINKSPLNLITGLGAFAAVLMLIFKDTILGFVAGVLLSENDMVHIGDWIEMPQNNVNGVVMDITLNIVKVQNFDNTIVTIPPYSLVSGSFINWRGMTESGGRRIMREYALKLDYIQPCTPEFLEKMKKFDADLADFITEKQKQAAEGKVANTDNPAGLVNGTIDTNVGLLRAYMTLYLKRHPFISKDLLLMVRTLAPTENGLPVQIYCFSSNKNWPSYESIQAEIMEHFVSVLPEFGLYPFQNPTARDYVISGLIESGKDLSTVDGIPWHSVLPKEEKV